MKLYIAFSGTASVGKTTLIKPLISLLEDEYKEPVKYITEVARSLQARGFKINKEATSATQRMIEEEYRRLETENEPFIRVSDRSIIDRFSYTIKNEGSGIDETKKELLEWYDANVAEHCKKYSFIFHIPLTDNLRLELDGIRSPDEVYRREIDLLQKDIINKYKLKVHTLSGTTEERLNTIKEVLNLGRTHGLNV